MDDNQSVLDLQVDEQAGAHLAETSRWARFLAITVLSATGLFVLLFVAIWDRLEGILSVFAPVDAGGAGTMRFAAAIAILLTVVIITVLMNFLLKGARAIRTAVRQKDQALFNSGLGYFRNYLAMMGVLSLIGLLFTLLGLLSN